MIVPPRDQTAIPSLHQSSYVDSGVEGFDRTASGKGGGRNTEAEATTKAWHDWLYFNLIYLIYAVIDEDEDNN